MPIFIGSRYETATVTQIEDSSGDYLAASYRGPSPFPEASSYRLYTCRENDRLDRLAFHFYKRSDLWWVIADANADLLLPDPLTPGTLIRIPDGRDVS